MCRIRNAVNTLTVFPRFESESLRKPEEPEPSWLTILNHLNALWWIQIGGYSSSCDGAGEGDYPIN